MSNITFNEFAENVKEALEKQDLPDNYLITDIVKVNSSKGTYNGIGVINGNIGPTFNLDDMYNQVKSYDSLEKNEYDSIAKNIIKVAIHNLSDIQPKHDYMEDIKNEIINKNFVIIPLNQKNIEEYGDKIPYKLVADIPFACAIDTDKTTVLLTNSLLKECNVTFDDVYNKASKNITKESLTTIDVMAATMSKGYNAEVPVMVCVSNRDFKNGANILTRMDLLEDIIKKYNIQTPIAIPSSKHEFILQDLNDFEGFSLDEIKEIISSVNSDRDIIDENEILSENLYIIRDGQLEIATEKDLELYNDKDDIDFDM